MDTERIADEPYIWGKVGPTGFDCSGLLDATDQAASFWTGRRVRDDIVARVAAMARLTQMVRDGELKRMPPNA
jgi:hypothetical protein